MACNCNTADPNCEPCAFCTPPGVKCLPDCNPEDPCPEKIDLCCVKYSGPDELCSDITTGMPLCDLIEQLFETEFPESECCRLEMSIDLLPQPIIPTTTTSTTSTTSTTTSTTISTTSTTTTTTAVPRIFCFTSSNCAMACECVETTSVTLYSNCTTLLANGICRFYTNSSLTTPLTTPGYYGLGGNCYVVSATGYITGISSCITAIDLCYSPLGGALNIETICGCSQS